MNKKHGNDKFSGILTKSFLLKHYIKLDKTSKQIGKEINCANTTVLTYLKKFDIKIHKITKKGRKIKSQTMHDKMLGQEVWNKGMNMREERPELVQKMINALKGKRCSPKGEFKKGHKLSLKKRGLLINKHHINLDKFNNLNTNLLFLSNSDHNKMHKRAYDYLVLSGLIGDYIKWFNQQFNIKYYNIEEYKKINKQITQELRGINDK